MSTITHICGKEHRPIREVAQDILNTWGQSRISRHAQPYLSAMMHIEKITDMYYHDSARSVVTYFLANATTWRGAEARVLKEELWTIMKM